MGRARKTIERDIRSLIEDVTRGDVPDVASRLEAIGFSSLPNVVDSFNDITRKLAARQDTRDHLALLVNDLLSSPDPSGALVNFLRYLEASGASTAFLDTISQGQPIREILATIFGSSQYLSDIVIRNPGYMYWLIEQRTWDQPDTADAYVSELGNDLDNFHSAGAKLNATRRFHRRMLLKIGLKDLLGTQTIEATAAALSALADAVVQTVLQILWSQLSASPGAPAGDPSFAVLAMGKLGGCELNYSSDIDLVYLCDDCDDNTLELYTKLARRLTETLTDVTPEGYLYRVDLRLRPDGKAGPLVNTQTSMRIYYENRGRPWEFQALLKARLIAGDSRLGAEFLSNMSGLIYNPSLSYSPLEDIALLRNRIRDNISTRDRAFNIKLMEGGIRDVEFIVQTLQLILLMFGKPY